MPQVTDTGKIAQTEPCITHHPPNPNQPGSRRPTILTSSWLLPEYRMTGELWPAEHRGCSFNRPARSGLDNGSSRDQSSQPPQVLSGPPTRRRQCMSRPLTARPVQPSRGSSPHSLRTSRPASRTEASTGYNAVITPDATTTPLPPIPRQTPPPTNCPTPHLSTSCSASLWFQADAAYGYWAVPMAAGHELFTSFIAPNAQYVNTRMPQGMTGAPHTHCPTSKPVASRRSAAAHAAPHRHSDPKCRPSSWHRQIIKVGPLLSPCQPSVTPISGRAIFGLMPLQVFAVIKCSHGLHCCVARARSTLGLRFPTPPQWLFGPGQPEIHCLHHFPDSLEEWGWPVAMVPQHRFRKHLSFAADGRFGLLTTGQGHVVKLSRDRDRPSSRQLHNLRHLAPVGWNRGVHLLPPLLRFAASCPTAHSFQSRLCYAMSSVAPVSQVMRILARPDFRMPGDEDGSL